MSAYAEARRRNLPHVFVKYERADSKIKDRYSYGIVGQMPVVDLIGYIIRVQAELAFRDPEPCDDCACVIVFDPGTHTMQWFVDKSIPVDALVGTLELIKFMLISNQMELMAKTIKEQMHTGLVNPDGKPILRKGV